MRLATLYVYSLGSRPSPYVRVLIARGGQIDCPGQFAHPAQLKRARKGISHSLSPFSFYSILNIIIMYGTIHTYHVYVFVPFFVNRYVQMV